MKCFKKTAKRMTEFQTGLLKMEIVDISEMM